MLALARLAPWIAGLAVVLIIASDVGAGPGAKTQVTIWARLVRSSAQASYGFAPTTGAMINGSGSTWPRTAVRLANVAAPLIPLGAAA
jgi:hypothetical protein